MIRGGGCTCGALRYEVREEPLFVHCCHCTWCQRETGSAFALNALIEARNVKVTVGAPVEVSIPSESGNGQILFRCPTCQVTTWSIYSGGGSKFWFLRVGTLDEGHALSPDIHIFTSTKQAWLQLSENIPACEFYYRRSELWPEASIRRRDEELAR